MNALSELIYIKKKKRKKETNECAHIEIDVLCLIIFFLNFKHKFLVIIYRKCVHVKDIRFKIKQIHSLLFKHTYILVCMCIYCYLDHYCMLLQYIYVLSIPSRIFTFSVLVN